MTAQYVGIIVMIMCFWFLLGTTLAYVSADDSLEQLQTVGSAFNYTIDVDTDSYNVTSTTSDGSVGIGDVLDMMGRMFTFRIPSVTTGWNLSLGFFNYLLVVVLAISLYRVGNPLA